MTLGLFRDDFGIIVGPSWDEKYHQLIGEINLKYLLSFGLVDENYYQKFRYSTLYWSLSSLFSQLAPQKYSVETFHLINALFGLLISDSSIIFLALIFSGSLSNVNFRLFSQ